MLDLGFVFVQYKKKTTDALQEDLGISNSILKLIKIDQIPPFHV